MASVLFVCTANVCRSPMASAIYRLLLDESGITAGWKVESAGTWAIDGMAVSSGSVQVMRERGVDIGNHVARNVNEELLASFDLILTMEKGHKEALRIEFPKSADRIYLVSEMAGSAHDIHDPIGGPVSDYEAAAQELSRLLNKGFDRIVSLSTRDLIDEH